MTLSGSDQLDEIVPEGFRRLNWRKGYAATVGPLYERDTPDGGFIRAFRVAEHQTNMLKNCHGGMLMGFADMVFGHVISHGNRRNWITVRLLVDFIAGAALGDWVEGTARVTGIDGPFHTVQGRIWVGERTVATGSGVFKVLEPR